MKRIKNLEKLLKNLNPVLNSEKYFIISYNTQIPGAIGLFKEKEGVTQYLEENYVMKLNIKEKSKPYALISLNNYSDLETIGFLANISNVLAKQGISINVVSAYYHDHLFVPWERREETLHILKNFSEFIKKK